jgi:hypothetical protein
MPRIAETMLSASCRRTSGPIDTNIAIRITTRPAASTSAARNTPRFINAAVRSSAREAARNAVASRAS